jgi:hypothetical protein
MVELGVRSVLVADVRLLYVLGALAHLYRPAWSARLRKKA